MLWRKRRQTQTQDSQPQAQAFNHRELLIKETLLIQEQQPEINADNFSTPLYLFNT